VKITLTENQKIVGTCNGEVENLIICGDMHTSLVVVESIKFNLPKKKN
jgi:hypothetical protein